VDGDDEGEIGEAEAEVVTVEQIPLTATTPKRTTSEARNPTSASISVDIGSRSRGKRRLARSLAFWMIELAPPVIDWEVKWNGNIPDNR
jgi:hypothetical protein